MWNTENLLTKIILVSLLLYFIIWLIFLINGPFYVGNDLDKRDWLSFLSGFLSFVGTIIITSVVIIQNRHYREMDVERLRFQNMPNMKFHKVDLFSEFKYQTLRRLKDQTLNPNYKELLNESKLADKELVAEVDNCPFIIWENGKFKIKRTEKGKLITPIKEAHKIAIWAVTNYGIGSAINVEIRVKEELVSKGEIYDFGIHHLKEGEKVYFEIMLSSLFAEKDKDLIIEFSFFDIFGNKYYQKCLFNFKFVDTKFEYNFKQKDREPIYVK